MRAVSRLGIQTCHQFFLIYVSQKRTRCFLTVILDKGTASPGSSLLPFPSEIGSKFCSAHLCLFLFYIQGYHYQLSKFQIYVLVYSIGVYLSAYFTLYDGLQFRENSIKTCILSRVKQITSPSWMHETSVWAWCTGKTQRDWVKREVGGGIGMGNTCKSMADSCQCMAKTTTIL